MDRFDWINADDFAWAAEHIRLRELWESGDRSEEVLRYATYEGLSEQAELEASHSEEYKRNREREYAEWMRERQYEALR